MQFGELHAYLENDRLVVLQHDLTPITLSVDASGETELIPDGDAAAERKALAYALWGPMVIRNRAYFTYSVGQDDELGPTAFPATNSGLNEKE